MRTAGADNLTITRIQPESNGSRPFQGGRFGRVFTIALLMICGCYSNPAPAPQPAVPAARTESERPWFVDVTDQVGLNFRHDSGATGELYLPEIMGSGAALVDIDRDGDLDLFLVQGGPLPGENAAAPRPNHRLFRNDLDASGKLRLTDISVDSGINAAGYGMGVATADYDNDGLMDLYVTNLGSNQLLRNLGQGRFEDVTRAAGVDDPRWSSSATFFDYDRDGHLDLFVTNYVEFDRTKAPKCYATNSARDYCGPDAFPAVHDTLFRNLGNGRFQNVTEAAGLTEGFGAGLGVIAADFNGDGWCDIYVANDGDPNQLWINQQGTGRFVDEALLAGVALNMHGQAEAGMGVDAADLDGDGDEELFVTNLEGESNTLYFNLGNGLFEDRTNVLGLRAATLQFTAFGTRFIDFDQDGDLDLFTMNGAVRLQASLLASGDSNPLTQTNQLFRNTGPLGFEQVDHRLIPAFATPGVSRGACIGDIDNDGDLDLLSTTNNGPAHLLLGQASPGANWIGVRLIDPKTQQDVLQTRVEFTGSGAPTVWRRVHTDGSYQSASDSRIVVGLGQDSSARTVTAHWPDGLVEKWPDLKPDQYHTLRRGSGRSVSRSSH